MVSMSEIQKDCFVCDHCNKALSDSKFVAIHDAAVFGQPECKEGCKEYVAFFESGEPEELAKEMLCQHILRFEKFGENSPIDIVREETYCEDCQTNPDKPWKDHIQKYHLVKTMDIKKGEDYSNTILASSIYVF